MPDSPTSEKDDKYEVQNLVSFKSLPSNSEYVFSKDIVKTWSSARIQAWKNRERNPDAYYYRFVDPHEFQTNGGFSDKEKAAFLKQLNVFKENGWLGSSWGMFSLGVPHKAGYQCSAYYKSLLLKKKLTDPSYSMINGKLVMINKVRKNCSVPSFLSDSWKESNIKRLAELIDNWVKEFHSSINIGLTTTVSKKSSETKAKKRVSSSFPYKVFKKDEANSFKTNIICLEEDSQLLTSKSSPSSSDFMEEDILYTLPSKLPSGKMLLEETLDVSPQETPFVEDLTEKEILDTPLKDTISGVDFMEIQNSPINSAVSCTKPEITSRFSKSASFFIKSGFKIGSNTSLNTVPPSEISKLPFDKPLSIEIKSKERQKDFSFFWKGFKPPEVEGPDPVIYRVPDIVPYTWAKIITPYIPNTSIDVHNLFLSRKSILDILADDLMQEIPLLSETKLEGILIDPPWPESSNFDTGLQNDFLNSLSNLLEEIIKFMASGFIFIWVPKILQSIVFKSFTSLDLRYVENLVWCQENINNRFHAFSSQYFCSSKCILLIFKKGEEVDIRHQRSADVIFDFQKPTSSWKSSNLTCPKPPAVYDMIETLLPNARTSETSSFKLLELWAKKTLFTSPRSGWIQIHQSIN